MLSQKNSHLYNASFIDELYETYLANPSQVNDGWRHYFAALQDETPLAQDTPHGPIQDYFAKLRSHHSAYVGVSAETFKEFAKKQVAVLRLINAYRFRGHQQADLDPLKLQERPYVDELNPEFYGLNEADLHTIFNTGSLYGPSEAKLSDILERLKKVYCGTLGAEYMHITETKQKRWIQKQLENPEGKNEFDSMTQLHILRRLTAAQGLEDYLHSQYVGQKRFSLEGGESLIPLLDELIEEAGMTNVKEIVLGMAHRGRLNVLVNILGKRPKDLFSEFEGKVTNETGSGDVKYHQGFSSNVATASGALHVTLAFNPSHLEIINPVVEGSVRARQERLGDKTRNHVIPVLIHGDSAVAGHAGAEIQPAAGGGGKGQQYPAGHKGAKGHRADPAKRLHHLQQHHKRQAPGERQEQVSGQVPGLHDRTAVPVQALRRRRSRGARTARTSRRSACTHPARRRRPRARASAKASSLASAGRSTHRPRITRVRVSRSRRLSKRPTNWSPQRMGRV